jgi:hypothetical protein
MQLACRLNMGLDNKTVTVQGFLLFYNNLSPPPKLNFANLSSKLVGFATGI